MNPGLYFAIGKKARDLLYKDYAQQQPLQLRYQSFDWSFDFSCQIEEILPGVNTVFRVTIPDSGKAELQYLRDYVGFNAGVGLKANPATGFEPIANISGVIGSNLVSLGADLGIDITTGTLNKFSTGLSLNSAFLIASLTLSDSFDSVKASFYHLLNAPTRTAIAAELKHRSSSDATTLTIGAQHALFPFTLVKARMNTDGKVSAVLRQAVWQRFYVSIAGEIDLADSNNVPRIGLSMALKP
ncbi:mitochondrial outer membrane protein porin of 36 kDa-like [Durio zibethinus]|uniref:Mitochondrial outer membrane protein porin of 36 kDa-like n=1 Tax=Durio zibethinus TaxID=66656 RepID=A0A6P5YF10_DURZI|nr:mitochondrial outer membrane protein porin of 36 kDa-like [Durio zibethinus]